MGVVKADEVIAWEDGNKIICAACGDPGETARPLTEKDFEETDIVNCDDCGDRIQ